MKKITFLIVMLCFWMGHSQVAQRATPTLSQADSRMTATSSQNADDRGSILAYAAQQGIFESAPFTVASRTQEIAPVSNAACSFDNPSNAWEDGFNYTGAFSVANDFEVPAGTRFDFDQITYDSFAFPGQTITGVDVAIYADAGGFPGGTAIASFAAVVPTSQTLIGGNFGLDGLEVVLDMPVVPLDPGVYWVGLNNGASSGGDPLYWEVTSATMEGSPAAQNGAYPFPIYDGVYSFSGDCSFVINFDPAAAYIGYANVFETPANGGGFVYGSPWGVSFLKTVVDPTATVTLQPNFNQYDDNPTDPFWVDQATGLGNKDFEGNTYVDDPSLVGQQLLWTGFVQVNDLDPSYAAEAFIKVFNADYSVLKIETAPLVAGEYFEVARRDTAAALYS